MESMLDNIRPSDEENEVEQLETMREEARTVLDHQIKLLNDIDDKAARTVRITAILMGALFGAASIVEETETFINIYSKWAGVAFISSVITGMYTYSSSEPELGPNAEALTQTIINIHQDENDREYLLNSLLLGGYVDWIPETARMNSRNGTLLDITQTFLAIGLIYLSISVSIGLNNPNESQLLDLPWYIAGSVVIALIAITLAYYILPKWKKYKTIKNNSQ